MLTVLLVALVISVYGAPVIQRSTKENITVLGDQYTYGIFEIDFQDTNLSYYANIGYCKNRAVDGSCPPQLRPTETCPCDYTDPTYDFCSSSWNPASHPCNCSKQDTTFCPNISKGNHFVLKVGDTIFINNSDPTVTLTTIQFFAYNTNCNAYLFRMTNDGFDPRALTSGVASSSTNNTDITDSREVLICPGDYQWGKTFAMILTAASCCTRGVTKLTLETVPLPPPRAPSTCSPPSELSTHTCIPSGVQYKFTGLTQTTLVRFVVPVDKRCATLMWTSSVSFVKLSFSDPWTHPSNSSDGLQTRAYAAQSIPGLFGYCLNTAPVFGSQHYIYGWIYAPPNATIFFDTNNEWSQIRPISEIVAWEYPHLLQGAVTVNCGSKSFTQWASYAHDVSTIDDGFANVRFVWPQTDAHPFWPPPPYSTSWQWQSSVKNPTDPSTTPGRLVLIVLLSQRLMPIPTLLPSQLNYEWITKDEFETCSLKFNGLIVDSNGPVLSVVNGVDIEDAPHTCNNTDYQQVSNYLGNLLNQSKASTILSEQSQIGYLADLAVASNVWHQCRDYLDTFAEEVDILLNVTTDKCTSSFGSSNFMSDPCCYATSGSLESQNCVPTTKPLLQEAATVIQSLVQEAYPETPQCAAQSILLLNDEQNRQRNPEIACEYTDKTNYDKARRSAWYQCYYPYFGTDSFHAGTPCQHDDECPDYHICTSWAKTCALNQTKQGILFLNCLIDAYRDLDPYILINTCNDLAVDCVQTENRTRNDIALDMFDALRSTTGCSYNYWMNFEPEYNKVNPAVLLITGGGCAATPCAPLQLGWSMSSDELPIHWDCLVPITASCAITTSVSQGSCDAPFCNYKGGQVRSTSLCVPGYFCGICDDGGQVCRNLGDTTVNGTCPTDICILANNTVQLLDSTTCLATMGCTVASATNPALTEAECNNTGTCSDATDPFYSIFGGSFSSYSGACVIDIRIKPPFSLGRDLCTAPFRTSVLGCLSYTVTETGCLDPTNNFGFDPTFYLASGIRWVKRATNETECAAYGTKCITPKASIVPSSFTDITINSANCANPQPLFVWTPGKWYPGQPRVGSGTPIIKQADRTITPGFSATTPSAFDPRKLYEIFQKYALSHFALIMRSQTFCRIAQKRLISDDLMCQENCYIQSDTFQETQLAVACSQDLAPIKAYPFSITLSTFSLNSGVCEIVRFVTQSITFFQDNSGVQFNTVLLSPTEDTTWAVRNSNDAIFGKVLTDGMTVQMDYSIFDAKLCIPASSEHFNWEDSLPDYPTLDVAVIKTLGTRAMIPLGKNATFDNGTFCVDSIDLKSNSTYYFVMRLEGTPAEIQVITRQPWTNGEIAYISVILALYCIGLVITSLGFIAALTTRSFFVEIYLIFITLILFFVFRIVLFGIALGSPYSLTHPAVGYLLIEFPLILFFAFVSLFIITWSVVIQKGIDAASVQKWILLSRTLAIVFLLIVFGFFILLIILFNTLVKPPVLICRDSILYYDADTAFAMVMAYRATFSTFAFILGICLAYVGSKVIHIMIDPNLSVPLWTKIKVSLATCFGTFGLFAQALYYLVLTATRGYHQSTYLSLSILLVDEVIPALFFMACVVSLPSPKSLLSSSRGKSKTKTIGSGSKPPSSSKSSIEAGSKFTGASVS